MWLVVQGKNLAAGTPLLRMHGKQRPPPHSGPVPSLSPRPWLVLAPPFFFAPLSSRAAPLVGGCCCFGKTHTHTNNKNADVDPEPGAALHAGVVPPGHTRLAVLPPPATHTPHRPRELRGRRHRGPPRALLRRALQRAHPERGARRVHGLQHRRRRLHLYPGACCLLLAACLSLLLLLLLLLLPPLLLLACRCCCCCCCCCAAGW